MKAILGSLRELTGAPAGSFIPEYLDLGGVWAVSLDRLHKLTTTMTQTDAMKKKNLEHRCDRFIKSVQTLVEKEGSRIPQSLAISLDSLIWYGISCFWLSDSDSSTEVN